MIEKIDILQHGEDSHLGFHSGEEAAWLLGIVAYHHEVVIQLRKDGLDSLTEAFVSPCRWTPVLLVQPVWDIKCNVYGFKQVQLYGSTQVSLISKYHAVSVFPLHIFKILQVMHVGGSHVEGVYDSGDTAQGVELISIIVHVLRGAVAPGGCMLYVVLSHLTPVGTGILADLYRLGVNAEDGLATIYCLGYGLTDILAKHHGLLATLVVLPTCNQVGNGSRTFRVQPLEEVVLAVNTQCLCCDGKCHHLQIGEGGNDTTSRDISLLIYIISCKFLADLKNFSELCDEVAHIYDNSTYLLGHH